MADEARAELVNIAFDIVLKAQQDSWFTSTAATDIVDALLAHPETVIAALGGERVAWEPNIPLYVFPVPGSLPTTLDRSEQ